MTDRTELEALGRKQLIARATEVGVTRPEVLTRVELIDELLRVSSTDEERQSVRGWLGVARDLVAGMMAQGFHLPDAAKLIRGGAKDLIETSRPPAVATVTLAEIYAAQGHQARALSVLDSVLSKEPDHEVAKALRERLATEPAVDSGPAADEPPSARSTPTSYESRASMGAAATEPDADSAAVPDTSDSAQPTAGDDVASEEEPDDSLWLIRGADGSAVAYWEIREATLKRLRSETPGAAVLELAVFRPDPGGARRTGLKVPISERVGSEHLTDLPAGAVVRGALSWQGDAGLRAFSVGAVLREDATVEFEPVIVGGPETRQRAIDVARRVREAPPSIL